MPVVAATDACFGSRPVEKAFGAEVDPEYFLNRSATVAEVIDRVQAVLAGRPHAA